MPYFNHTLHAISVTEASYWERRAFIQAWWAQYADDSHWTPPAYGRLSRELDPRRDEHLARLDATLIHIEALHRTGLSHARTDQQEIPLTSVLERPLAAAVAAIDPRRKGRTAHLALANFSSDREAFDILYYHLVESLSALNYHRFVGPVGLSPHLGSGLQVDGWDDWPPLHAPSNPPYMPELVEARLRPIQEGRLFRTAVESPPPPIPPGPAIIRPLDPARLASDLLPLLVAATENPTAAFPPPDEAEARFLLRVLGPATLAGHLAEVDGVPAGFVLLGPDTAEWARATRGGRSLWRRVLYASSTRLLGQSSTAAGRLYFGAVLPTWRRQGIGSQLWHRALLAAGERGWESLSIGPLWKSKDGGSAGETFLSSRATLLSPMAFRLYEATF